MKMIEKNIPWPDKDSTKCIAKIFSDMIDGFYR